MSSALEAQIVVPACARGVFRFSLHMPQCVLECLMSVSADWNTPWSERYPIQSVAVDRFVVCWEL